MLADSTATKRTNALIACGVLLLAAVSAFWMLPANTLSEHECFVSITAKEMLQSGDWFWPTCNATPRIQKTPLSYWLVAIAAGLTGRVDEFAARLPSAFFAVLSVAAILYFVRSWLSFRIAAVSACVWLTSLGYVNYSHNARPEMILTFFVLLSMLSFYSALAGPTRTCRRVYALLFWVSFALANLAKGPAPIAYVCIPLFFYVLAFRSWKKLPDLLPLAGPIIFIAIVLPWPLAVAHKLDWDLIVWKHEFIDRLFGKYAYSHKPPYYYLGVMFQFAVPWVAFAPLALAAPFSRRWKQKRQAMWFLWLWFVADLLFLTVDAGKRQHYILPLMPAMAILTGIIVEDMAFTAEAYPPKFARNLLRNHILVITVAIPAALIYVAKTRPALLPPAAILATATVVVLAAVAAAFAGKKPALGCGSAFTGIVAIVALACTFFLVRFDHRKNSRYFAKIIRQIVPQSDHLVAYKFLSMKLVHYFGRPVPLVTEKDALYERYKNGDWVFAAVDYLQELAADNRFRMVFYRRNAGRWHDQDADWALFHKSSPPDPSYPPPGSSVTTSPGPRQKPAQPHSTAPP